MECAVTDPSKGSHDNRGANECDRIAGDEHQAEEPARDGHVVCRSLEIV